jgi:hypothetical protein
MTVRTRTVMYSLRSLDQLSNDELVRVLFHLKIGDLCRFAQVSKHCSEIASANELWAARARNICISYSLDWHHFEGNFLYGVKHDGENLPIYSGPPLRMPYLTVENDATKLGDEGLLYRCYPSSQQGRARKDRTDHVWITSKFPVTCCGAHFASRSVFEEHLEDIRHYERMQEARGRSPSFDISIDPRILYGKDGFKSMTMREQYREMRSYVDAMLPEIEARCDPSRWSEDELTNLRRLSNQGLSFMDEIVAVHGDEDDYFQSLVETCREDLMPLAIGEHICDNVLQTFKHSGVYSEAVPYLTVRDFLTDGLALCDPVGGSASSEQWFSGISELFESHYNGAFSDEEYA